jgi:mRNA interferase RelE/StbE
VNVRFKRPFLRDVKQAKSAALRDRLRELIERVEAAETLQDIPHLRKLRSSGNYRIRLGDYRVGVFVEGDTLHFARLLHRREFYRHFR